MNSFTEFIRNWFGFTRRERRSSFILLIMILIVTGIRFIVPGQNISVEEMPLDYTFPDNDTNIISKRNHVVSPVSKEINYKRNRPLLDINRCDSASLESLPGIGPVLSSRIIKYRNLIGGYVSVNQLREVYGLSEEIIKMNSLRLFADSTEIRKININKAEYKEMIHHPYFKKNEVSAIMKYRELQGKIKNIGEMIDNNLISSETGNKIKSYLDFKE